MFWIAVKVLFLRQIYGFKHRWIATVVAIVIPVVLLSLLHVGRQSRQGTAFSGIQNPLDVVVLPYNSDTEQLINDARQILQYRDNSSLTNLRMTFAGNAEQMNQSLWNSERTSVGVQFQEISRDKLEYTLRPVIAPRTLNFPGKFYPPLLNGFSNDDELPLVFLQLQAAIDAAYIRKYFPGHGYLRLRRFRDFPNVLKGLEGEAAGTTVTSQEALISSIMYIVTASIVSFGVMIPMWVLASYIVRDKLSGVRELLCVNGVPRWMVSTSWLFSFCLLAIVIALSLLVPLMLPLSDPLLPHINAFLLFILLVVYYWSGLVFSNCVANLLTSPLLTGLLMESYWTITTFVGWVAAAKLRNELMAQALISLLPNFGYVMFMFIVMEFSNSGIVLSFENLFARPDEYISAGLVLLVMLVNVFILLSFVFYLDAVKPGPYGRARPWYLFKKRDNLASVRPADAPDGALVVQEIGDGVPVGIKCVNIVKIFGTHKALNNVNLKIVKNSITILLGHNGAGKTTLFSILCGMFSPTSGEVYTEEYSIFKGNNIDKFRRILGYCPQENLLISELTVQEHLIIFGMLKGLTKAEALSYSDEWAAKFDMSNSCNTQAKNLSGGSKRKLCLAIAMTGDPQYLLLDEPSAGLDIESTRKFCDLVLKEKGNCTVVISTHNMDEADILGDRIAILTHGQLQYYGESSFLKRVLDTGYRLTCIATGTNMQDVIKTVTWYIKGATVLYKMNHSVTFRLPSNMMESVPNLLRWLEVRFGKSVSSSLSPSTLDDVFVEVQKDLGMKINVEELPSVQKDDMRRSCCNFSVLFWRRADWLLSKRIVIMIILVMLLPSLAMIMDMFLLNAGISPGQTDSREANLSPSLNDPKGHFALLSNQHDNMSELVRSALIKSGIIFEETSNASNYAVVNAAQNDSFDHRSKLLFALDTRESEAPVAYFPSKSDDAMSIAYSALINALLQGNASIITHRTFFRRKLFQGIVCPLDPLVLSVSSTLFTVIITPFFLEVSAYFVVFPHEERTSLFKHLLLMTGLLPAVYWLVNLLFDMLIYSCSCALVLTIMAIIDHFYFNLFLNPQVILALILLLGLYGLSSIMFSYVWSFFFHSSTTAILVLVFTSYFLTSLFLLLQTVRPDYFSLKLAYFLPYAILRSSVENTVMWALHKKTCEQCESGCQYEDRPLFQEDLRIELICFGALTVGYFLVLIFLDHGQGRRLRGAVERCCFGRIKDCDDGVDPEVACEKQRVDNLEGMDEAEYPHFVCSGLGKKYSWRKTAVYDVTFTAERGECFGLVGVNGAGKSTTFGMLAALLCVSKGTAIIKGWWSLTDCEYTYMKRVGYCPQYGGLLKELSARTILRIFGRLGGVRRSQIGPLVDKWIAALDMDEIARRPCGQYSGGNKRKLSLAVALIGNPPILLLDEPTAGVDPVVRRRIWEILAASLEQNEQTVILTSHTMSECEAICNRLTIMVQGVMKCLGPIPALKETFGKSYVLEVKFTPDSTIGEREMAQLRIESRFAGYIKLEDCQLKRLQFILKTEDLKMYDMLAAMLKIKYCNSRVIEDFNLSETPLEQVFLKFAQNQ